MFFLLTYLLLLLLHFLSVPGTGRYQVHTAFEIFRLLGCYASCKVVWYRRLGTTYRPNLQGLSSPKRSAWTAWPLKMGPICILETSVSNHLALCDNSEDGRTHFNCSGSLRSHTPLFLSRSLRHCCVECARCQTFPAIVSRDPCELLRWGRGGSRRKEWATFDVQIQAGEVMPRKSEVFWSDWHRGTVCWQWRQCHGVFMGWWWLWQVTVHFLLRSMEKTSLCSHTHTHHSSVLIGFGETLEICDYEVLRTCFKRKTSDMKLQSYKCRVGVGFYFFPEILLSVYTNLSWLWAAH
jgi:hypothetical protein